MNERRLSAEIALLVDVGSAWTKGTLIARARGRWRVVSHVAQPTSWGEEELHRTIAERLRPHVDPRLADRLLGLVAAAPTIACRTPRRPGRLMVAAVSRDLSGRSAGRAAESAGWQVAEMVSLDDGRALADRLAALQATEVDAWLLAGGFDGSDSEQALQVAALARAARPSGAGPVLWAGDERQVARVSALFEPGAVQAVPNVRPNERTEHTAPLRERLEDLLRQALEPDAVRSSAPVAFRRAVTELSRSSGLRIRAIDLGARYATMVTVSPSGDGSARVLATGGLGGGSLAASGAASRIARTMAHPIDELVVADALQNLAARPATVPHTDEELAVLQAAAQHQLSAPDADGGAVDLLVGAGRTLAAAPLAAQSLQMMLDGLRPLGVTQLAIDAAGLLGPLGTLDDEEIGEGMSLLREDLLLSLGTAVVCRPGGGEPAMEVTIRRPGWPPIGPIAVRTGRLQVVPLARGRTAELEIRLGDGASLAAGRRGRLVRAEATGGSIGIVFDTRGVPLVVPRRSDDRRAVLGGWRDVLLREPAMTIEARP